jgi:hypothetical protein
LKSQRYLDSDWTIGAINPTVADTSSSALLAQTAENNARWCDVICRAHGAPGELHEYLWLSRRPMPRFYPNVVTLSAEAGAAAQLAAVCELVDAGQLGSFAVKDSFASLDLAPLGFHVLFEATWLRLTTIGEPEALRDWEGSVQPPYRSCVSAAPSRLPAHAPR